MQARPPIEWARISAVILGCVVLIVATGYAAYASRKCDDDDKCPSFEEWIDRDMSPKSIAVGVAAGTVFGLIDNALLWTGMSALDTLFARLPGGDNVNVMAGYGNAFSSVISAFVSTFVGQYIADTFGIDVDKTPLWSMAFGILLGCILGIVGPSVASSWNT